MRSIVPLCFLLLVTTGEALAQVPFDACVDRQFRPIPGRVDNKIPGAAMASRENGQRVILWNQSNMANTTSTSKLFVYLHECAHHSLNHLTKGESRTIEDQADCWAYQLLVDGGMINGSHREELDRELKHWPGDIAHLGGEPLVRWLNECVALRTRQSAWHSTLTVLTAAARTNFDSLQGDPIADAPPETFETTLGTPGTFDCELIKPRALRCMVFAARKQGSAEKRFETLAEIFDKWLPVGWSSTQPEKAGGDLVRKYIAQDGDTGMVIILGLTSTSRVYFMLRPPPA
jgi:hypothetical protein